MVKSHNVDVPTCFAMSAWMLLFVLSAPGFINQNHVMGQLVSANVPDDSEDQIAVQRRNFLRFGKKSHPTEEGVDPSNEMFRGLNRRDYREFVRFGKRTVLPPLSVPVVASRPVSQSASGSEEVEDEPSQWLTLLGPYQMNKKDLEPAMPSDNRIVEEKRRDDFLRFGKKWNSNNKLMKAKILCQHRGINCDHLLKMDGDSHNNHDGMGIPSFNDISLDDLIALDKLLNGRLGKKSNDFLRFG